MIYAFADFELDDERLELRRGADVVAVQPKVLDLLFLLVRNRNRVVRKQQILEQLWPGVSVGEASLAKTVMGVRRALQDDGDPPEIVVTVRGRGFRFAKDVEIKRSENAAPAPAPQPQRTGLVGRDAIIASILESFEEARLGRGTAIWITGPHGIGRSSVLGEIVTLAKERGARAASVRCIQVEGAPPGWTWIEMARQLEIPLAFDPDPASRFSSFDAFGRAIRKAARTTPILLAFDDVEEMDDASAELLQFLCAQTDPILFVLALADGSPRADLVRELAATQKRLVIRALVRDAIATIVEGATGQTPSEPLLDKLVEKSGGNPGLLKVLLETWWAKVALEGADVGSSIDLEEGVVRMLGRALADVSVECKDALATAALFGDSFELAPFSKAIDVPMAEALDLVGEAVRAGLVQKPAGGVGSYRFVQPMVRDVLVKSLPASARAKRHGAVADALAALGGDVEAIADHMVRAAAVGRIDDAIEWALRAAEHGNARTWMERAEHVARLEPSEKRTKLIREKAKRLA